MAEVKKSRKVQSDREASLLLLCGFIACLWLKGDYQLYLCFAGGVVGKGFVFTQGLGKEYEANAKVEVAKATPTAQ